MDIDGVWQPQRTEAALSALTALYRTGRIADGSGSAYVAEIDARTNPTDVGFHPPFHSWSWRARIDRTLGNHDNNVIWVSRGGAVPSQFDAMRPGSTRCTPTRARIRCRPRSRTTSRRA